MKRLLTLIFAIMLVSPVFAQHSKFSRQFQRSKQPNSTLNRTKQFNLNTNLHKRSPLAIMQKMDSDLQQEYDAENSVWVNGMLEEFTYDVNGNNTVDIYSYWNEDTQRYEPEGRQELKYNDGILSEQMYYDWDDFTNTWEAFMKCIFSYDESGNMVLANVYYLDRRDWVLVEKEECTYDVNGNLTLRILSFINEYGGEWMYSSKEERTYNDNDFLTVSTYLYWDYFADTWLNSNKSENIYNGSGTQLIEGFHYSWDEGSSQWLNEYKDEFIYDDNMNLVLVLEEEWTGSQWFNSFKTELTYNNAYPFDELIIPWMFMEEWEPLINHMLVEMVESEYLGSAYFLSDRTQYNFSEINITGINNIESNRVNVYPQPANGYVTFEWESSNPASELELYDINGRLVVQQKIEKYKSVDIHHLAPGLYFYRLTDNQQHLISGKMSVR